VRLRFVLCEQNGVGWRTTLWCCLFLYFGSISAADAKVGYGLRDAAGGARGN
jgi:hypothetical protein